MLNLVIIIVIIAFFINVAVKIQMLDNPFDGKVNKFGNPIEAENALVVVKRSRTIGLYSSSTLYYITFEFEKDSTRIEYGVSGEAFGLIAEGDKGILSYQDKKFINFERIIENNKEVQDSK